MQGKYKVITLCGSTRFKDEFLRVQKELTLKGYIVISVGLFGHSGDNEVLADGVKEMLDDMHLAKIDMAVRYSLSILAVISGKVPRGRLPMPEAKGKRCGHYARLRMMPKKRLMATKGV